MKIAILGSGGREHALTFSISKSNKVEKITIIPMLDYDNYGLMLRLRF